MTTTVDRRASGTPAGSRPRRSRANKWWLSVLGVAAILLCWQVFGGLNLQLYSRPSDIVAEITSLIRNDDLLGQVGDTVTVLVVGWSLSVLIGVFLGYLIGRYHLWQVILEPYITALYSLPRIAFVPLLVIWLGIGHEFLIATIVTSAAIMMTLPTAAGIRETRHTYSEMSAAFCISRSRFLFKVLLPGALPFIATGMRISVQRALMTLIVAEFFVGAPGLGQMLSDARARLAITEVFAVAAVALVLGVLMSWAVSLVERRLSSWRPSATDY